MAEQEFSGTKRFRVLSKLGAGGMASSIACTTLSAAGTWR